MQYSFLLSDLSNEADLMTQTSQLESKAATDTLMIIEISFIPGTSRVWISLEKYNKFQNFVKLAKKETKKKTALSKALAFRAECLLDVLVLGFRLWSAEADKTKRTTLTVFPDPLGFPDVSVIMYSRASREELLNVMRSLEEGTNANADVMEETLSSLSKYTGVRA